METPPQIEPTYQHDAFISYSRRNKEFASRIEKALERYTPPKDLNAPQRHLDVFRDEEDFTGSEYHRSLEKHLKASAKLIVICSPEAYQSRYVNEEIRTFVKLRGADNIVAILLSGIPNNEVKPGQESESAFPPALCEVTEIPLAADFRAFGPGNNRIDGKAHQNAWYKTLADLYGLERAEVEQRDKKRQARTRRIRATLTVVVATLISTAAIVAWQSNRTAGVKKREASQLSYVHDIELAQKAYESTNLPGMAEQLKAAVPNTLSPAGDLRGFEWYYLWRLSHSGAATMAVRDDSVRTVAFSPDGKLFATAGNAKTVKLWSAVSYKQTAVLGGQESDVTSLAFSPDGKTLAVAGAGMPVRLWDVGTGKVATEIGELGSLASSAAFSFDGKYLATIGLGGADKIVKIWDVIARKIVTERIGAGTASASGLFAAFSPNGKTLAMSSGFGLEVFRVPSGESVEGFADVDDFGRDSAIAFSPDGRTLVAASESGKLLFYDTASGRASGTIDAHSDDISALAFSPDGKTLASASADNTVKLWDVESRTARSTLRHARYIAGIAFAPDGRLATASGETLRLWEMSSRQEYEDLGTLDILMTAIAPSPQTDDVALASASSIVIWDTSTRKEVARLKDHSYIIHDVALSADHGMVAIASDDAVVELWEPRTRKTTRLQGHKGAVYGVAFSPDGKLLASASADHTVKLWDVASRHELATSFTGHTKEVRSVAFSPDGKMLATGSNDGTIRLWDPASGHELASARGLAETFQVPRDIEENGQPLITAVRFSPDGHFVVAGTVDGTAKVWHPAPGALQEVATLAGHKGPVNSVALSPDGRTIATGSTDATVKLWDTLLFRELLTFTEPKGNRTDGPEANRGSENQVAAVAFSHDGRTLVSGLVDGTVRFRRAASDAEVAARGRDGE